MADPSGLAIVPPAPDLVALLTPCGPASLVLIESLQIASMHSPVTTLTLERFNLGALHNYRARDTRETTVTSLRAMVDVLTDRMTTRQAPKEGLLTASAVRFACELVRVSNLLTPMGSRVPSVTFTTT